jgi:hypothetical protein
MQQERKIDYTKSLVVNSVTADIDLVPDNRTSRISSDVINLERLACGKGTRGVVETTAHIAATCARRRGYPLNPREI